MFTPNRKFFEIIQIIIDILVIVISIYLAFWLRIELNPYFSRKFDINTVHSLMPPIYLTVAIFIFILNHFGLYKSLKKENFLDIFFSIIKSVSFAIITLRFIAFLFRAQNYSRSLILLFWGVILITLTFSHLLGTKILKWSKAKGFGIERIVVVGIDEKTKRIAKKIEDMRNSIYQFAGYIKSNNDKQEVSPEDHPVILGKLDYIVSIINDHMVDRIIVSESSLNQKELYELIQICERMEIHLDRIPDFLSIASKKISLSEIDGILLLGIHKVALTRWDQILKRIFDLIVGTLVILLLFPFLMIISFLIKIDSKGPIFYKQKRLGKGGRNFYFIKFRSMIADAEKKREFLTVKNEAEGYLFKIKKDPRITKMGKFIRKFSIDELASLGNVLIGKMSLVGPRPLPYSDMKKDLENSKHKFWAEKRAEVLPGITGLWQISGRSELSFEEMVKLDIYYVENWTPLLDIKILLKTIPIVLSGKGSY